MVMISGSKVGGGVTIQMGEQSMLYYKLYQAQFISCVVLRLFWDKCLIFMSYGLFIGN